MVETKGWKKIRVKSVFTFDGIMFVPGNEYEINPDAMGRLNEKHADSFELVEVEGTKTVDAEENKSMEDRVPTKKGRRG